MPLGIDDQRAERETGCWWRVSGTLDPREHASNPEHELGRGKRLGQVIVRTQAQTGDSIGRRSPGGQDDDGRVRASPNRPDDGEAVDFGKHEIEDDQGRIVRLDGSQGTRPVVRLDDPVALALQVEPDEAHDLQVVVDDEDGPAPVR